MNKHIQLLKKWLAKQESVSYEELRGNAISAEYEHDNVCELYAHSSDGYDFESEKAYALSHAVYQATQDAAFTPSPWDGATTASIWVVRYESLIKLVQKKAP